MRLFRPKRPLRVVAVVSISSAVTVFIACSGSSVHPDAGNGDFPDVLPFDAKNGNDTGASSSSSSTGGPTDSGSPDACSILTTCCDGIKNAMETDVDCGGGTCPKCIDGKTCVDGMRDCAGGTCINGLCSTPNCHNGVRDGDETDIDCGGSVCPHCTIGKRCMAAADCSSDTCDTMNAACACPPTMVIVAKATGGAYCIDATEVTKGQYNKFLTANVPVGNQIPICQPPANTTFVPRGAWPPATAPPYVQPNGLPFSLSLPVHYVNWCDAYTYCQWAGKTLCGEINGGSLPQSLSASSDAGAWYNACSAQGTKEFAYGTTYQAGKCNDTGPIPPAGPGPSGYNGLNEPDGSVGAGYGFTENQDDGVWFITTSDQNGNFTVYNNVQCQGGSVGLYQMLGNVAEWEDSCDTPDASAATCNLRGGSYAAGGDSSQVSCSAQRSAPRLPPAAGGTDPLADVGFRCCLY